MHAAGTDDKLAHFGLRCVAYFCHHSPSADVTSDQLNLPDSICICFSQVLLVYKTYMNSKKEQIKCGGLQRNQQVPLGRVLHN